MEEEEVKIFVQECLPTLSVDDLNLIMETFFYLGVESFDDLKYIEPEKDLSSVLKHIQARKLKRKIETRFNDQGNRKASKFLIDFRNNVMLKLNRINQRLTAIEDRLAENEKAVAADQNISPLDEYFPLSSLSIFLEFEQKLLDADYYAIMVNSFKAIGGKDFYAVTTNILKKLITDDVAELYSWSGQKKKMAFKDLLTVKVVMEAVRAHRPTVTETEVAELISRWLVQAKQRNSRASMRQMKNSVVAENMLNVN